ncbi:hypothetical protein [Actinoplanes subtropicus]|uniref:hypothetical protein n=1 Tax=Actinoplanes subtropicus TaxID=543632 RepID=UPI0004C30E99|nr:hypothetical protein [Actinoplanes subtropicus]
MTIFKGLREAIVYIAVCAGLAAAFALAWLAALGGQFSHHFGACLIVLGSLVSVTGGQIPTKLHMADVNAWVGIDSNSPTEGIPYGALTSVGVFLFVTIPLVAVGLAMA